MRIITGTARGCRLKTLEGQNTRPTAERVKEAIFSALAFEIEGRRVLDLFAGSGQMGLEALSRGAKSCVFVDNSREAAEVVRQNVRSTGLEASSTVLCRESLSFLAQTAECFDLVFLDPPYASDLLVPCLEQLGGKTSPFATIVCETDKEVSLPDDVGDWQLYRLYRYGRVFVRIYRKKEQESL